jgi:CRISPR-associated protein Csb2
MFALAVEFLMGRYVATAFNDRDRPEWPPHPARLYSALVATHFDEPRPDERAALEWLEEQGDPYLSASESFERETCTAFVPVNDKAAEPDRRLRQPRTSPSVTPARPRVVFVWPEATPSHETAAALDRLAARVVRLGHSSSLVSVRTLDEPVEPDWHPDDRGEMRLRVVAPGQLRNLEQLFALHRETEPRVMPASFRLYSDRSVSQRPPTLQSVFSEDWLILRRSAGIGLPATATVGLARMVRKVILSVADEPIPEVVSGHRSDRTPSEQPHLAVVPLPFVGHARADGALMGVALVLPRTVSAADRRALFRAVEKWENAHREGTDEAPPLPVNFGSAGSLILQRLDDAPAPRALEPDTWCRPARRWLSATPVALDKNPGELRARDPRQLAQAIAEAEETVRLACERIGLPRPVDVVILPSPALPGAPKVRQFMPFPGGAGRVQRVLTHVAVEFAVPVKGPVLLGAGRYVGLGLMRPVDHV